MHAHKPDLLSVDVVYITRNRRGRGHNDGRPRQQRDVVDGALVPALGLDELRELGECGAVRDGGLEPFAGRSVIFGGAALGEDAGAERETELEELAAELPAQQGYGLLHLQRVADGAAQGLFHISDAGDGAPAVHAADLDHLTGEDLRLLQGFHECPAAALDVQDDDVRARGELFGHDAADDERDGLNSGGHVAQGVEFFIRGVQVCRLPGDGKADLLHLAQKALLVQGAGEAGEALKLVQRAAGVAEAAPGHFGHPDAAAGHHGQQRERGLVPDAARGMLVRLDPAY